MNKPNALNRQIRLPELSAICMLPSSLQKTFSVM